MIDSTANRVKEVIDFKGLSVHAFEKQIGAGNNVIGTSIKRNSSFSSSTLSKILSSCPDISPEWLLTGRGSMLRSGEPPPVQAVAIADPCAERLKDKEEVIQGLQALIKDKERFVSMLQAQVLDLQKDKKAMGKSLVLQQKHLALLQRHIEEYKKKPTAESQKALLEEITEFIRFFPKWALE